MRRTRGLQVAAVFAVVSIALASATWAQQTRPARAMTREVQPAASETQPATTTPAASVERRLPPDQTTNHTLELPGRSLKFAATAGSLPLHSGDGRLLAEMSYVAYTVPASDTAKRPVVFAFNGGPGSASTWLHLGALGPWRLPLDAAMPSPSTPPVVQPNAETFLDFADLVFIDPVGTGYSRIASSGQSQSGGGGSGREGGNRDGGGSRFFWSVNGDAESVAEFIQLWLRKADRLASPKVVLGESYGGIRGPKVVSALQTRHGVGVNALVLVSPVLDFGIRGSWRGASPTGLASVLPSLAASAIERRSPAAVVTRTMVEPVEAYARGEYIIDLLRGPGDTATVDRMARRIAEFVDLPEAVVKQYGARLDSQTYRREANRGTGQTASIYDSAVKSFDPDPTGYYSGSSEDPFTSGYAAPMTSAIVELYRTRLAYRVDATYQMSNRNVMREWVYPNSAFALDATGDLRAILALDPKLKVLVTHGFTDTITPYFGSVLALAQIPPYGGDASRLRLVVHPGGHMFYSRDNSRKAFRDDVAKLLE